ncbi:Fe-S cluster assembly ATPase SufC [Candidatus Dojkabacteria bacterium]|uniref:Fe-S cluster assembly ATPase SufC n=1 Tax=Candidatus Dojkabacteria bacterium TaxID=2099670 RepID=A0A955I9J8_9BACT|nr:Fe-S cluster assembly ATPase SufC [Candidatus Dojkabacteria bacterium]
MLKIKNLHCQTSDGKEILKGVNLEIKPGDLHVLMGPNGSGKSTLSKTLMGHPSFEITEGTIELDGENITDKEVSERAHSGLFVAYQYPVEVPGVNFSNFLRLAYNSNKPDSKKLPVFKFRKLLKEKANQLDFSEDLLDRNLNEDLSGGEKKKAEILQLAVLKPKYAILDETDSGLDLDALKSVFQAVNNIISSEKKLGVLIITHYQRIFDYINPDFVHVLRDGRIVESGDKKLINKIEKDGYKQFKNA